MTRQVLLQSFSVPRSLCDLELEVAVEAWKAAAVAAEGDVFSTVTVRLTAQLTHAVAL